MNKKRNKNSDFTSSVAARKIDVDKEINLQNYCCDSNETVLENNTQSPSSLNNKGLQSKGDSNLGEIMKIIYSKFEKANNKKQTQDDIKTVSKESTLYGFYTMCYISLIYFICYLLADNKTGFQFSSFDILFTFISCLIFISSLIFLFKIWLINAKT